ncbi:unnamed protein product [Auanema sp. JU1783]|nr:unnamed protein product [Auanema sp. JU1783]
MTAIISSVLSSVKTYAWILSLLSFIPESYCRARSTGRSIKWYPGSDDFSSEPFHLNLSQGDIIAFVCKPELPMSFYSVSKEDYFSCRKTMHSLNVGSCDGSNNKFYQTLRSDSLIPWKPDTYYIIAVDNYGKREYCKESYLKMMLTVAGADQPKVISTTELIPEDTPEFRFNPATIPEFKTRNSRDRVPLSRLPERFHGGKVLTSQEILNGRLAACIMLNPSYYTNGKATDLMDTRYLPLYGSSGLSTVVLPILVALFLL